MWYSMGSSMVIILISGFWIFIKNAYRLVVFPLPVGPVTTIMPLGFWISLRKMSYKSWRRPRVSSDRRFWGFKILITTDSPYSAGRLEVLISIKASWTLMVNRPSCALSVIFNFILLSNFKRDSRLW